MEHRRIASMSELNGELNGDMAWLTINDPRKLSPSPSTRSDASTNYGVPRKSLPDLRTPSQSDSSVYSQELPMPVPPPANPFTNTPPLLPVVESGDILLAPPPPLTIQTQQTSSPPVSRPTSRAGRVLSRPVSRDAPHSRDAAHSRENSRVASRSGSPTMGPPALQVDSKLKKRRSWLPGSSPIDLSSPTEARPNAQAWLITPRDKIPYDLTALSSFKPVCLSFL